MAETAGPATGALTGRLRCRAAQRPRSDGPLDVEALARGLPARSQRREQLPASRSLRIPRQSAADRRRRERGGASRTRSARCFAARAGGCASTPSSCRHNGSARNLSRELLELLELRALSRLDRRVDVPASGPRDHRPHPRVRARRAGSAADAGVQLPHAVDRGLGRSGARRCAGTTDHLPDRRGWRDQDPDRAVRDFTLDAALSARGPARARPAAWHDRDGPLRAGPGRLHRRRTGHGDRRAPRGARRRGHARDARRVAAARRPGDVGRSARRSGVARRDPRAPVRSSIRGRRRRRWAPSRGLPHVSGHAAQPSPAGLGLRIRPARGGDHPRASAGVL